MIAHHDDPLALFSLGQILVTKAADEALLAAGVDFSKLIERHVHGDWGDVCTKYVHSNEQGLRAGGTVMSRYLLPTHVRVWVMTMANRSETWVMLPSDSPALTEAEQECWEAEQQPPYPPW